MIFIIRLEKIGGRFILKKYPPHYADLIKGKCQVSRWMTTKDFRGVNKNIPLMLLN